MSDRTTTDLERLLGPAGPEVTCEECFELLDQYVELELARRGRRRAGARHARAPRRAARPAARTTRACARCSPSACGSAQDAGVPDRVAAGLRPDRTGRAARADRGCGAAAARCGWRSRRPRRCSGPVSQSTRPSAETPPMSGEPPPGRRHLRNGRRVRNEISVIDALAAVGDVQRPARRGSGTGRGRRAPVRSKRILAHRSRVDQPDAVATPCRRRRRCGRRARA